MTIPDMVAYFESLDVERRFAAGAALQVDRGAGVDGCGSPAENMNQSTHQHQSSSLEFGLKSDLPRSFSAPLPPGEED